MIVTKFPTFSAVLNSASVMSNEIQVSLLTFLRDSVASALLAGVGGALLYVINVSSQVDLLSDEM
jgi:hypothetical protein